MACQGMEILAISVEVQEAKLICIHVYSGILPCLVHIIITENDPVKLACNCMIDSNKIIHAYDIELPTKNFVIGSIRPKNGKTEFMLLNCVYFNYSKVKLSNAAIRYYQDLVRDVLLLQSVLEVSSCEELESRLDLTTYDTSVLV